MLHVYVPTPEEIDKVKKVNIKIIQSLVKLEDEELIIYALYELIRSYEESSGIKIVKKWSIHTELN